MPLRIEKLVEPIPGYRLLERLGAGGFGEVWKAEAPGGLFKAIKFVYGDLQVPGEALPFAERELKALSRVASVRHPYILSLERFDVVDGQLIIVMELADCSLWDRFKDCRARGLPGIPRDELLRCMEEAAEALDLMNAHYGLQHLDIKPQNLFLVRGHLKIGDFGLVKDVKGKVLTVLSGGLTPVYAAPETFDGMVSRYSDQYSLAIVYQEMLTGQRPFTATSIRNLVLQHLEKTPNLSALPAGDRAVIRRALSNDPEARFPRCHDLVAALRAGAPAPEAKAPAAAPPGPDAADPLRLSAQATVIRKEAAGPERKPAPSGRADVPVERPLDRTWPMEFEGDGVLRPALVVGLGGLGLSVLQQLRRVVAERFGSADAVPHVRLLYLDTDAETLRANRPDSPAAELAPGEVLLTPLNRASYYLKPREGRTLTQSWLEPQALYRIPRNLATGGLRVLGRLALVDHHPTIVARLRAELEACTAGRALTAAMRQTRLSFRTNRPRVYLVASLMGGTGSGMFVDMAYLLRQQLRQRGYVCPDVVGVLILPPGGAARGPALANTFAALTELNHFAAPGVTFSAWFPGAAKPLQDADAPFGRCVLLPAAEGAGEGLPSAPAPLAGEFLYQELFTTLGRTADQHRTNLAGARPAAAGPRYTTFGLCRLSWPQRLVEQRLARALCGRVVRHWLAKDSPAARAAVPGWMHGNAVDRELSVERLAGRFRDACKHALGRMAPSPAADLLREALEEWQREGGGLAVPGEPAGPATRPTAPAPDPQFVRDALAGLGELTGDGRRGALDDALRADCGAVVVEYEQRLAELAVHLIELPEFRLAGAEEAVRRILALIKELRRQCEAVGAQLVARAEETARRILAALGGPRRSGILSLRQPSVPADPLALLPVYARLCCRWQIVRHLAEAYTTLHDHLSGELAEMNVCRGPLGELEQAFAEPAGQGVRVEVVASRAPQAPADAVPFPVAGQALTETGDGFLALLTPEDVQALDQRLQAMIRKQFTALVEVCLTSSPDQLKHLARAMLQEAEAFVRPRLTRPAVAGLFLERFALQKGAAEELGRIAAAAAPRPSGAPASEVRVVAAPFAASARFAEVASQALSDLDKVAAEGDSIFLYRESAALALAGLEQAGPAAADAFQRMLTTEQLNPHCRADVEEWQPLAPPDAASVPA